MMIGQVIEFGEKAMAKAEQRSSSANHQEIFGQRTAHINAGLKGRRME